jgi:SEC-C motif-containing protein
MPKGKGFAVSTDQGPCPCGGGVYRSCCGLLHRGEQRAETAEQLMRSRYSAFARGEVDYLLATHHEPDVPAQQRRRAMVRSCRQTRWLGLTVLAVRAGGPGDLEGTVQFEARYRGGILKETSLFARRDADPAGDWLYIRAQ